MANETTQLVVATRWVRLDPQCDGQVASRPAVRVKRGDGGYAPHGGAAGSLALITPRGAAGESPLPCPARPVKPDVLDWSIISAWQ